MSTAGTRLALRDYQLAAVAAANPAEERGLWVGGCGTGKTIMASAATAKLLAGQPGSILMLFLTLGLLEQTYRVWRAEVPHPFEALAACSEKIGDPDEEDIGSDDLSVASTTSPERLARWLSDTAGIRVVFGTYQSLPVITAAHTHHGVGSWAVVVCDEAHKLAASAWGSKVNKTKRFALADETTFWSAAPSSETKRRRVEKHVAASVGDRYRLWRGHD